MSAIGGIPKIRRKPWKGYLTSLERQLADALEKNLHSEIFARGERLPPEAIPFVGVPGASALSADCKFGEIALFVFAKTAVSAVFVCSF